MTIGWEPETFLDWPEPKTVQDREIRRHAKVAVLTEALKLLAKQRENQALMIGQAFAASLLGGGD